MNNLNIDLIFEEMINRVEYSAFLLEYHRLMEKDNFISKKK